MVAMVVMVLVVYSATTLLVSSIRSNASNINTLIAYGLAQEGLEAVRNVRDSDWLLGANFSGVIGGSRNKTAIWGAELPSTIGVTRYYTVDINESSNIVFPSVTSFQASQLRNVAPWKLTELSRKDIEDGIKTMLYKKENVSPKEVRYTHVSGSRLTILRRTTATPFHRYLVVSPVAYEVGAGNIVPGKKLRVASVVEWEESGRSRQVRLDSELTDWMQ